MSGEEGIIKLFGRKMSLINRVTELHDYRSHSNKLLLWHYTPIKSTSLYF